MPACKKHPKFNVESGVYYRVGNPDLPDDWVPKSEAKRRTYYAVAAGGDPDQMAGLMGEAMMIHSGESSAGSAFVSVAGCPACLAGSKDPTVIAILKARPVMCRLVINPRNQAGAPFIFEMGGEGVGAGETEALVLLGQGQSLITAHDGYVTMSYVRTMM